MVALMDLEGDDGSKIELRNDSETVFGRGFGFNTEDRTVSRCHVVFHLDDRGESLTEPRAAFEVVGKNPVWVRRDGEVMVFRNSDKGEAAVGDCFCISSESPTWFNLRRVEEEEEEKDVEMSELGGNLQPIDASEIDPVKEFGFLVIGHEFDCYGKQRIRDVKNWDWFLEEAQAEESSEDDTRKKKKKRKRKGNKVGGNGDGGDDDDDWTGESEEDKMVVSTTSARNLRPKYTTRSKEKNNSQTAAKTKNSFGNRKTTTVKEAEEEDEDDDDDDDNTLGGFIVTDGEEQNNEEIDEEDEEEEEEFIDEDEVEDN